MTDGTLSKVLSVALGVTVLVGAGGGIYFNRRLNQSEANMQAMASAQNETIQKLNRGVAGAEALSANLQTDLAAAQDRLGMTRQELTKAERSSAQMARLQKQQQTQWSSQLGEINQERVETQATVGNLSSDVAGVKEGLSSTKEQVASTQSDLQRVVGDLGVQSDLVARNHGEIEELRALGQRDYVEFDVGKGKDPQHVGTVAIGLKKVDAKRERYTINLVTDDRTIEKRDKTVDEPVQFYQAGFQQPSEIVVNKIEKDRIEGYISFPKKKQTRPALSDNGSQSPKTQG